jgi:hypothetical protein
MESALRVVVMNDHAAALGVWIDERNRRPSSAPATVIHIDRHSDLASPPARCGVYGVPAQWARCVDRAGFQLAAAWLGLVGAVWWLKPGEHYETSWEVGHVAPSSTTRRPLLRWMGGPAEHQQVRELAIRAGPLSELRLPRLLIPSSQALGDTFLVAVTAFPTLQLSCTSPAPHLQLSCTSPLVSCSYGAVGHRSRLLGWWGRATATPMGDGRTIIRLRRYLGSRSSNLLSSPIRFSLFSCRPHTSIRFSPLLFSPLLPSPSLPSPPLSTPSLSSPLLSYPLLISCHHHTTC